MSSFTPVLGIAQIIGTGGAIGAVAWAFLRRSGKDAADQAQVDAAQNWRELAESREAQLRERDLEIAKLIDRMSELEKRFVALETENKLLRALGNSASQIETVAARLAALTATQHAEVLAAIKAKS